MGRKAIFILGGTYFIASLGLCMIYFMAYADTMGALVSNFYPGEALNSVWYTSRYFYVLTLAAVLIPVVLKKELAELKVVSVILFVGLGVFVILSFI